MDKKTISLVVKKFNDIYFKNIHQIVEKNFDFIDSLGLPAPKQNYLFTYDYLTYVYDIFVRIDNKFVSHTLNKLKRDIDNLQELLQIHEDINKEYEEIFDEKFLPKSQLFTYMTQKLEQLKEQDNNPKEVHTLQHHLKELKKVYLALFKNDFIKENRYILKNLKEILNTKIYYFDKLLWIEAQKSYTINTKLKKINMIKGYESKMYLLEILEVIMPYSQKYKYFEKCLKVYK